MKALLLFTLLVSTAAFANNGIYCEMDRSSISKESFLLTDNKDNFREFNAGYITIDLRNKNQFMISASLSPRGVDESYGPIYTPDFAKLVQYGLKDGLLISKVKTERGFLSIQIDTKTKKFSVTGKSKGDDFWVGSEMKISGKCKKLMAL